MVHRPSAFLLLSLPLALSACFGQLGKDAEGTTAGLGYDETPGDSADTAGGSDSADTEDTSPVMPPDLTVDGIVRVELYWRDANNVRQPVGFDEVFGGVFPYGSIFVGGYTSDASDGQPTAWFGNDHVPHPNVDGDPYVLSADPAGVTGISTSTRSSTWPVMACSPRATRAA